MELRDYWRALRQRAWIPLLLTAVTVVAAGAWVFASKPGYTAQATVITRGNNPALPFSDVATANAVVSGAIDQLKLSDSVDQLRSRIQVLQSRGDVYRVSISDPDATHATAIANTIASQAAALYPKLAGGTMAIAVDRLQKDQTFLNQYQAAASALISFQHQHPDAVGTNATPKDVAVATQLRVLQLQERAASDAYGRYIQALTDSRVNSIANDQSFGADVVDQAIAVPDVSPPLEPAWFVPHRADDFYLVVSRLVSQKRIDIAIDACLKLGVPLVVVGDGRDRARLERRAHGQVRFLGRISDAQLRDLYARARALLVPGEEDFGLTPLEAQAAGTPVIAFDAGGAQETVLHGESGLRFRPQRADALATAMLDADSRAWDRARIQAFASAFDLARFRRALVDVIDGFRESGANVA